MRPPRGATSREAAKDRTRSGEPQEAEYAREPARAQAEKGRRNVNLCGERSMPALGQRADA